MSLAGASLPVPFRRIVTSAAAVASLATLALILYVLVVPARAAPALRWYVLFLGGVGVVTALRALTTRYPVLWRSSLGHAPEGSSGDELPQRLRAIERLVTRARWDAAGFELELRPILRAIAAQRLATYRTIDSDVDPAAARAILGERVWTILTPVKLETARSERGVNPADLRAAVEALEAVRGSPHP